MREQYVRTESDRIGSYRTIVLNDLATVAGLSDWRSYQLPFGDNAGAANVM